MADRIAAVITSFVVLATVTTLVMAGRNTSNVITATFNGLSNLTSASLGK